MWDAVIVSPFGRRFHSGALVEHRFRLHRKSSDSSFSRLMRAGWFISALERPGNRARILPSGDTMTARVSRRFVSALLVALLASATAGCDIVTADLRSEETSQ